MKITMRLLMMLLPLTAMTAFATPKPTAPTDQQCKDAWNKSESAQLSYCKLVSAQGTTLGGTPACAMTVAEVYVGGESTLTATVDLKILPHVKSCHLDTTGANFGAGS